MTWETVLPGVLRWRDSCNVYALIGTNGCVIVDAGTGQWLDHLGELPSPPVALLCTHYFRDHSAGALLAAQQGIPVYVPEYEHDIFADAELYFQQRESYVIYENGWSNFAPIEAIPVAGVLRDYLTLEVGGLTIEVIPLPGVSIGQVGLGVTLPADGRRVVLCGEAIHSPGKLARVAPLQWDYNGLPGAVPVVASTMDLRARQPDALLPSLGEPILSGIAAALSDLEQNLRAMCNTLSPDSAERQQLTWLGQEKLSKVADRIWQTEHMQAYSTFIQTAAGRVIAIDYGYHTAKGIAPNIKSTPYSRRPLLHSLDELQALTGKRGIDVVLVSHFHDDHINAIPLLQRVFQTECWAAENFADILANPQAYAFPCTWPLPIQVHRRLPLDQTATFDDLTFHLAPMSGHTRFSALIGFELDGLRYAHTGDQYFPEDFSLENNTWEHARVVPNHVYRNGAFLDSFRQSAQWLREWKPDVLLTGHIPACRLTPAFFDRLDEWTETYESLHRRMMPLAQAEAHFEVDSWGGWIQPYRSFIPQPAPISLQVTVRNPFPRPATLDVRLVGPSGWVGASASLQAPSRAEMSCQLSIAPTGECRRQAVALELVADGRPFGQVAEALVTVGGERF